MPRHNRIMLEEGFFGHRNGHGGKAQIIATSDGSKPQMGIVIGSEGYIGGYTYLWSEEAYNPGVSRGRTYCENMWIIRLDRKGNICNFILSHAFPQGDQVIKKELGDAMCIVLEDGDLKWPLMGDYEVRNLLMNELLEPAKSAIERSYDKAPEGLYWGIPTNTLRVIIHKTFAGQKADETPCDGSNSEDNSEGSEDVPADQELVCASE